MELAKDEKELEAIYGRLYAHTRKAINSLSWYLKPDSESTISGKQVHDYVMDTIEFHLTYPNHYDPQRGELIDYLKFNVLRNLIGSDIRGPENRTSRDVLAEQQRRENSNESYIDSIYPLIENVIGDQFDLNQVLKEIEKEVMSANDEVLESVFLGIIEYQMTRDEIMTEFNLSAKDYVNAYRRLGTIRKRVQKMFNISRS